MLRALLVRNSRLSVLNMRKVPFVKDVSLSFLPASLTHLDLAGCSAKLGVDIGMGAAGTAIGAFQEAADALGQLGGCVGVGGKCNLDYLKRPCFYKALSNRPKGASKQSSQCSHSKSASPNSLNSRDGTYVYRSIIISDCIEGWKYFHHTKYCYKHFPYHVRYSTVQYSTVQYCYKHLLPPMSGSQTPWQSARWPPAERETLPPHTTRRLSASLRGSHR